MKKKINLIIILMALIALIAAIMLFNLQRFSYIGNNENPAGTIVKADKYKKQAITEKDVLFRTELATDTVRLKEMMHGLKIIRHYNTSLIMRIDSLTGLLLHDPLMKNPGFSDRVYALRDFGVWLTERDERLGALAVMMDQLLQHRLEVDPSVDVEKELRDLAGFITDMSFRDIVLEHTANALDQCIRENGNAKAPRKSLSDLGGIRDQLYADYLLTTILLGDKINYARAYHALVPNGIKKRDSEIVRKFSLALFDLQNSHNSVVKPLGGYLAHPGELQRLFSMQEPLSIEKLNIDEPLAIERLSIEEAMAISQLKLLCVPVNRIEPEAVGGLNVRIEPQAVGGLHRIEPE